jgi:hypothetical protein
MIEQLRNKGATLSLEKHYTTLEISYIIHTFNMKADTGS